MYDLSIDECASTYYFGIPTGKVFTMAIPTGRVIDSVRLYASYSEYGTLNFDSSSDLQSFAVSAAELIDVDLDNNYLIRGDSFSTSETVFFQPYGGQYHWSMNENYAVLARVKVPYFKVLNEVTNTIMEIHFNYGISSYYSKFEVKADTTTGAPSQNRIDFTLTGFGDGTPDTDTVKGYRKLAGGDDVDYTFTFFLTGTHGNNVEIKCDHPDWTNTTLSIDRVGQANTYGDGSFRLYELQDDTDVQTAISQFSNTGLNPLDFYITRDNGTAWAHVDAEDMGEGDQTGVYADVDLSGQGNGDKEIILQAYVRWPGMVRGLGMAWSGD